MDYARIYWLCSLGIGLLLSIPYIPELLAGNLDVVGIVLLIGGVGMTVSSLYELARPTAANGPTEPTPSFWVVVIGFVLVFSGTVLIYI